MKFADIGARVRKARTDAGITSLEKFAEQIASTSDQRPSVAKLSRIEAGVQPVPLDVLEPVARITGIPVRELRPDLAVLMNEAAE